MEKYFRLLLLPFLSFLLLFLLSGFYNRLATDDFEFLTKLNDLGFVDSIIYFYDSWTTRWVAIGFLNLVLMTTNETGTLFWYHLLSIILLGFAFYRLIKSILTQWPTHYVAMVAGMTTVAFFYSCFSVSEVFYWVNSSAMYLYGSIAFLFAAGEVIYKKLRWFSFPLLFVSGMYLGGSYEPLVFTSMLISIVILIYTFVREGGMAVQQRHILKLIVLLSVLMVSFAISYAGKGHVIRAGFLPQTDLNYKLVASLKAIAKMFVLYLPAKLPVCIMLCIPWFLVAAVKPLKFINLRFVLLSIVVFSLLVIISLTPVVFIMSEMGPARAWTQISIYTTFLAAVICLYLGGKWGAGVLNTFVPVTLIVIATIFILYNGTTNVFNDSVYSAAYDRRMLLIKNTVLQEETDTLYLEPLPLPGWLQSAELSSSAAHHSNQQLRFAMGLEYQIATKASAK